MEIVDIVIVTCFFLFKPLFHDKKISFVLSEVEATKKIKEIYVFVVLSVSKKNMCVKNFSISWRSHYENLYKTST